MKFLPLVCRVLLGLVFVFSGANMLHPLNPALPSPAGTPMGDWNTIMMVSNWMKVVGFFQLLGGLLVLVGRTAPLGLVILAPIIVNVLCFHILLAGGKDIAIGVFVGVLEVLLVYFYRENFAGIFATNARPVVTARTI